MSINLNKAQSVPDKGQNRYTRNKASRIAAWSNYKVILNFLPIIPFDMIKKYAEFAVLTG